MSIELVLNIINVVLSIAAVVLSLIAAFRADQIDLQAQRAFQAVADDMSNHEARVDQLEDKAGIPHVHSPSAQAALDGSYEFPLFDGAEEEQRNGRH